MNYICKISSPIGILTVSSDGINITGLWNEGQKYFGITMEKDLIEQDLPVFGEVKQWLNSYFMGIKPMVSLPLAPKGSSFRQLVWAELNNIPYGEIVTYGDIAKQLAKYSSNKKVSAQAVGGAVGHNPISIIIPCHRVVGSNGNLTGYASGLDVKIKLLELERVPVDTLYKPMKGTAL